MFRIHYTIPGHQPKKGKSGYPTVLAVAIVPGKRPVPFRTRKLSLVTLMVLHSRERGRVRNRRHSNLKNERGSKQMEPRSHTPKRK